MRRAIQVIIGVFALVFSAIGCANGALAQNGPPVPEPQELIDLVRSTVLAVHEGNTSGDYRAVSALAGSGFNAAYPSDKLKALFSSLRLDGIDLGVVKNKVPMTSRPPVLDLAQRLRVLGFFELSGKQLVYDLLYDYDANQKRWLLAAISLVPRALPPQPQLMQPQ